MGPPGGHIDGTPSPSAVGVEEARITQAYARRRGDTRYSVFDAGHLFMVQDRERRVLAALRRLGWDSVHGRRILDLGCGTAPWLRMFVQWGADPSDLAGIDLQTGRVVAARARCPAGVGLGVGSAASLPFADGSFDLVLQATVFSSILEPALQAAVAREMGRVVRPGGAILWYDMRVDNPWNRDVRGLSRARVRALFPGWAASFRSITLAPPLVRRMAPRSWLACAALDMIPFLRTHWLATIVRPPGPPADAVR
jgi:ubiquinone/menaquinone biosynthesis C-methylase UbiE